MRYEAASNSPFPKMDRRVEEIRKKRGNTRADQGSRDPTLANPARMGHPLSGSLMRKPKSEKLGHPPSLTSIVFHGIPTHTPALASLAPGCKGCLGTVCKGCQGNE